MSPVRRSFYLASVEQYLALIVNLSMVPILARLLTPEEIGIAVIGLGISVVVFSLREFVTAEFLIVRPTVEATEVRTASTVLVGATVLLAASLALAGPFLAGFYHEKGLAAFFILTAAAAVIEVFASPAMALLRRDMRFGDLATLRTGSLLASSVVTVVLAATGWGFMSYAWGALAASVVTILIMAFFTPVTLLPRPTLASWRVILDFGRFRGAAGIVDRVYDAIPQLVLGRVMPMTDVGLYNRANAVCAIPDRMLLGPIFSIAFPVLAERARSGRDVGDAYLRALSLITAVYWPALLLLAILAEPVVRLLLGPSWLALVPIVRIMAIASLFFFPVILTHPILMAMGHNRAAFLANLSCRLASASILCVASFGGIMAMALSLLLAGPLEMLISLRFVRRAVRFEWKEFFLILGRSVAASLGAVAGPLVVLAATGSQPALSLTDAAIACLFAAAGWFLTIVALRHPLLAEFERIPVAGAVFGALLRRSGRHPMGAASEL